MKKFLVILLILNIFTPSVFALKYCSYDYDGNRICKKIKPDEVKAIKHFRRVDMYDENGKKVRLYLKTYRNITRVINSRKAYIGSGFEDTRGNVHIIDRGRIVKTFYVTR